VQLHLERLAWLEHWRVLLQQESQKLVTVVSTNHLCWADDILTNLQMTSLIRTIGKRRRSNITCTPRTEAITASSRRQYTSDTELDDTKAWNELGECSRVMDSGRSALSKLKRATRPNNVKVIVDTKNDRVYSSSLTSPSSSFCFFFVPY
jgi:hypothetical protein